MEIDLSKVLAYSKISVSAFSCCSSLININLPKYVKRISSYAFELCFGLTKIVLNEGLSEICSGAFVGCNSLISLTIPSSVNKIADNLFVRNGYKSNKTTTIYAYPGSPAIEFARKNNLPLKKSI